MSRTSDRFRRMAGLVVPRMQGEKLETDLGEFRRMVRDGFRAFIVFGARLQTLREGIRELEREAGAPLLVLSDLEQGVGQQVEGGTLVPSAMSLAHAIDRLSAADHDLFRHLFSLLACEARMAGVNVVLAPVADLHVNDRNPIICTRAYGSDPEEVAWFTEAQVRGLQENPVERAVLACAKHFPGHGRTEVDSHLHLPRIHESLDVLTRFDLLPFRAAARAGCRMIMLGHLLVPCLDPDRPTSRSGRVIRDLLRNEMGYEGLIITDAMNMAGAIEDVGAETACLQSFQEGCDLILHPPDPYQAVDILTAHWTLLEPRFDESWKRVQKAFDRVGPCTAGAPGAEYITEEMTRLVNGLVPRSLRVEKGQASVSGMDALVVLDEDLAPSNGRELETGFRRAYPHLAVYAPASVDVLDAEALCNREVVVALFSRISGWKGRSGLSLWREALLERIVRTARRSVVISFGCPTLLLPAREADTLIQAWWASPLAERAVVQRLCGKS